MSLDVSQMYLKCKMLCYTFQENTCILTCACILHVSQTSPRRSHMRAVPARGPRSDEIKARAQGKFFDETKSWGDEFHVRRLRVAFRIFAHLRVVSASRARGLARPAAVSSELGGAAWVEAQALHRGACEAMKAVRATQARRRSAARHSAQRRSTPRSRGSPRLLDLHPGRRGE